MDRKGVLTEFIRIDHKDDGFVVSLAGERAGQSDPRFFVARGALIKQPIAI